MLTSLAQNYVMGNKLNDARDENEKFSWKVNFKQLTHKSRISMVFRCLKNYKGILDFAGPQGIWYSFIFSIDINHSLYLYIIH